MVEIGIMTPIDEFICGTINLPPITFPVRQNVCYKRSERYFVVIPIPGGKFEVYFLDEEHLKLSQKGQDDRSNFYDYTGPRPRPKICTDAELILIDL